MPAISGGELFQSSLYVGINIQDVLYGIELVLYFATMHILLTHEGDRTTSDVSYAIFSSAMLLITTIWIFTQAIFCGKMWLLDSSFWSGPDAFWAANVSVWYMDLATSGFIVLQLMTDGLMVYRCCMVWNSYRVIIIPLILWAGTLVLGILVCWTSSAPGGFYFQDVAVRIGLAYFSASVFLTAILTFLICYRLVKYGRMVKERLGQEYASPYFGIVALVVESVLPCTLSGTALLVSLGLGSGTMGAFGYVHGLTMCVSAQMLILRVAIRRSLWKETRRRRATSLEFSPQEETVSNGSEAPPYA